MIRFRMKNYNTILNKKLKNIFRSCKNQLSSRKIDRYEYLTGEEILPSNQKQIKEKVKLNCSALGKAFEKQIKTIKDQGKKQVNISNTLKPKELKAIEDKSDHNEKHLKCKEVFNELYNERMNEIYSISKEIDFNKSTSCFKCSDIAPMNFFEFKGPMHIYNEIKKGNVSIEKIEEDKKKKNLNQK